MSTGIYIVGGIVIAWVLLFGIPTAINMVQIGPKRWLGKAPTDILGKAPEKATAE